MKLINKIWWGVVVITVISILQASLGNVTNAIHNMLTAILWMLFAILVVLSKDWE